MTEITDDTPNPYLNDRDTRGIANLVDALVQTNAYAVVANAHMAGVYTQMTLAVSLNACTSGDAAHTLRGYLFEVARQIHDHTRPDQPIEELKPGCNNPEHDHEPEPPVEIDLEDQRDVVMLAGMEWFRAIVRRDMQAADNVLKALHKELAPDNLPDAYVRCLVGAVISMAASLQASAQHDDEHEDNAGN